MDALLTPPLDGGVLLQKKRRLLRNLRDCVEGSPLSIAILGGSTTNDIADFLELFLLDRGIKPCIWQCEYARYYEEGLFPSQELSEFSPDVIVVHTTSRNVAMRGFFPVPQDTSDEVEKKFKAAVEHFHTLWESLNRHFHCPIIQNNCELPLLRVMGNYEMGSIQGTQDFVLRLNVAFADYAREHTNFYLHDIAYLSACYGLEQWSSLRDWHMYKYALAVEAIPEFSYSLANILCSLRGKNQKLLAVDLDNTLWGGVIGDDGVQGIELGSETPLGEGYLAVQRYVKSLADIGVVIGIASKNDEDIAIGGLQHPNSLLCPEDFVAIKANWNPKSGNLIAMARGLDLSPDSIVFLDDNPAERGEVTIYGEGVRVLPFSTPEECLSILNRCGYFEVTSLSEDDRHRTAMYRANAKRYEQRERFGDYDCYLESLAMRATITPFAEMHLQRIMQLTNKSNQFNLTTKRYTLQEIKDIVKNPSYLTLYGRLEDCYGDNGIVSVLIGEQRGMALHMDLWLMSCRVLRRGMEYAMLESLINRAEQRGIMEIYGYYYPTKKNQMVAGLYDEFGFTQIGEGEWVLSLVEYSHKPHHIKIEGENYHG